MTSETKPAVIPKILRGPSRIELLEAMFFDRNKMLTFNLNMEVERFNRNSQLFAKLLGIIPTSVEQAKVLILGYTSHYEAGKPREQFQFVVVYDDHLRTGRFTSAATVDELLSESWYTNKEGPLVRKSLANIIVSRPLHLLQPSDKEEYLARTEGGQEVFRSPHSAEEAIGKLVRMHSNQFRIHISEAPDPYPI